MFVTVIKNERKKTGIVLWTRLGEGFGVIEPCGERTLETDDPEALAAPFSEIIYRDDAITECKPNPEYPLPPAGKWLITIVNVDGLEMERRIVGGREVCLPKGIPRSFGLTCDDPLAVYSRMEIKNILQRGPSPVWKDYNEFKFVMRDSFTERPANEIEALLKELDALATEI